MNSLLIIVCLLGPLSAFHAHNLLRDHGPPIKFERSSRSTKEPELHYITQRLDNFNASDLRTWTMRYLSNDELFQNGGPIFIYLGGEGTVDDSALTGGQTFEMARQHNGYMFYTEHRYYGRSFPTRDMSTENLKYLTTEQALADVVHFVRYVKSTIKGLSNSKVVVVGCSYAANLATWIRLKYPEVIDAAYASSGPVKAVADYYEYFEVVGNGIELVSQECKQTLSEAMAGLEEKLASENGISELLKAFSINKCVPIQNVEPYRSHFFYSVIVYFGRAAQGFGLDGLRDLCHQFLNYSGTAMEKLIKITNANYCKDYYKRDMEMYSHVENTVDYVRQWKYQTCTELGYYQTTTSDKQPFGHTIAFEYYIQMCKDLFGKDFGLETLQRGVNRTNSLYGSTTPNVTKVLSVHGSADPWHPLGILKDLNPLAPAIFIDGSTHCQDLYSFNVTDSHALKGAQRRAREIIAEWIK